MTENDQFPLVGSTLFSSDEQCRKSDLPDPGIDLPENDSATSSSGRRLSQLQAGACKTRYTMLGEVGRGGMGAIFKVRDNDLRRTLAMKVMTALPFGPSQKIDPVSMTRFLEEAQVTGQLDHPGIVPLHELGMDDKGRVYFTMRLVRGKQLSDVFKLAIEEEGGWNFDRAVEALVKVAEAMGYAHSKGVVHRDLKPQNVMCGRFGEVYVMDWGLAKVMGRPIKIDESSPHQSLSMVESAREPGSGVITIAGAVFGTPAYMAPEQARGLIQEVNARSNMYSFGAILYQLLTGQAPYVPKDARLSGTMVLQCVLEGPPTSIRKINPRAPRELIAICEKAMHREASKRYSDMQAVADDLRAWLAGRPVSALKISLLGRSIRWCKRYPLVAAALCAITFGATYGILKLSTLNKELTIETARDAAAQEALMLEHVNSLYAKIVAGRVDKAHTPVTHDFANVAGAIPIPATFLTELASAISVDSGGVTVRHYSDYPFLFRGEPKLDDFGRHALAELRKNPQDHVEQVDVFNGRPVLRYAVARPMAQSCVDCHNSHPESPKKDWKVGDVRGVLEILRPLDDAQFHSRSGLATTLASMSGLVAGLAILCVAALVRHSKTAKH